MDRALHYAGIALQWGISARVPHPSLTIPQHKVCKLLYLSQWSAQSVQVSGPSIQPVSQALVLSRQQLPDCCGFGLQSLQQLSLSLSW